MTQATAPTPIELLLESIDRGYDHRSWHGPNLRGSIRGVSSALAEWRVTARRKTIAEHVAHAAYWKYSVRRRLREDPRGSFPLSGSNWFEIESPLSPGRWKALIKLLETEQQALRAAVAAFPMEQLASQPTGSDTSYLMLMLGVAAHDVYHAGQIQLLKRLHQEL